MKWWLYAALIAVIATIGVTKWNRAQVIERAPGMLVREEPLQTETKTPPFWDGKYRFRPLFDFKCRARVLSVKHYVDDRESEFCPTDLALGWGKMSDTPVLKQFSDFSQSVLHVFLEWQDPPMPQEEFMPLVANMHIIPADDDLKRELRRVKKGEIVEFSGHLVEVTAADGFRMRSSTTRLDWKGGACEVVYIKSLKHGL